MQIANALIVISGASSGIGAAAARALAREGARVVLLARTASALETLAEEIRAAGGSAWAIPVDLTDDAAVEQAAQRILSERGTPDVIINNAGAGRFLSLEETSPAEARAQMDAPYFAAFYLTRSLLPAMIKRRTGTIVNVTSPASFIPWPGATAYAAARWAMRGLTSALRADLRGTGLRVMLLMPGKVSSAYFTNNPGSEERLPAIARLIPTWSPEQVAEALVDGLRRDRREVVTPGMLRLFLLLHRLFPRLVEGLALYTGWRRR